MAQQHVMRIELSSSAKSTLEKLSGRHGMTQMALMSRLVEWFVRQDELVQPAITGGYPQTIAPEVAKLILKRVAAA